MQQPVTVPIDGRTQAIADVRAVHDEFDAAVETGELEPDFEGLTNIEAKLVTAAYGGELEVELSPTEASMLAASNHEKAQQAISDGDPDPAAQFTSRAETVIQCIKSDASRYHARMTSETVLHATYDPTIKLTEDRQTPAMSIPEAVIESARFRDTLSEYIDELEGERPASAVDHGTVACDRCNDTITTNSTITMYLADADLAHPESPREIYKHRIYCQSCSGPAVQYPSKGVAEAYVTAWLDKQYVIGNVTLKHVSERDHGFEWDPLQTFKRVVGINFDELAASQGVSAGPEDVVDQFVTLDIDFRKYINDDGSVSITSSQRAEAKNKVVEFATNARPEVRDWQLERAGLSD
jgi:hypothetical protein